MCPETVSVDEIETAFRCVRKYEFEFEHTITTSPDRELESAREALLRDIVIQTYRETADSEVEMLRQTARTVFEERWADHAVSRYYQSQAQRRYDRQAVWAGIDTYLTEYGEDHHSRLIAAGATGEFTRDPVEYSIECDLDLVLDGRGSADVEIIRIIPKLQGVIWSYNADGQHPIDSLLQGDTRYRRQKASVLRAIASRLTALTSILEEPLASAEFKYVALMNDTYPTGPITDDGGSVAAELAVRDMSGYIYPGHMGNRRYGTGDTQLSNGQVALLTLADTIREGEYDPAQRDFDEIYQYVCPYCKFKLMCPDYINEEVRF